VSGRLSSHIRRVLSVVLQQGLVPIYGLPLNQISSVKENFLTLLRSTFLFSKKNGRQMVDRPRSLPLPSRFSAFRLSHPIYGGEDELPLWFERGIVRASLPLHSWDQTGVVWSIGPNCISNSRLAIHVPGCAAPPRTGAVKHSVFILHVSRPRMRGLVGQFG
jgi:hypothetical protein